MATRCNLIVKEGKTRVYLYRHWDGYPAECGAVIATALAAAKGNVNSFMVNLLANQYEATAHSPAQPMYEFTNDLHGDVEYVYEINFNRDPSRMIRVSSRGSEYPELEQWCENGTWCSLQGLVAQVNSDRLAINNRMRVVS